MHSTVSAPSDSAFAFQTYSCANLCFYCMLPQQFINFCTFAEVGEVRRYAFPLVGA